jgi:WD40 repeat protein
MEHVMEFLVTSEHKIFFSVINPSENENSRAYYPHPLDESRILDKKNAPTFTQSIFLHNNQKGNTAITGTTAGYIIVWDVCEALCKEDEVKTDRRKIKTVDLLGKYKKDKKGPPPDKDRIEILVNYKNYIVIGTGGGTVNFYDYNFIIVRWFENICWMVRSISFDMEYTRNKNDRDYYLSNLNEDTANTSNFKCAPFITSDVSATVKRIYNEQDDYITYGDETMKYEEIYRGVESEITCIAVHPRLNIIAVGTRGKPPKNMIRKSEGRRGGDSILKEKKFEYRAYVQLFYYPNHMKVIKKENERKEEEEKRKKQQKKNNNEKKNNLYQQKNKNVEEEITESRSTNIYKRFFAAETYPTCLEFSSCDNSLMVGTSFQKILPLNIHNLSGPFLDKNTMLQIKEIADKDDKNAEITDIQFSPDKKHFAATDNLGRIGLFKLENNIWSLVARFHFIANTHIISFCFNEIGDRIFAITEDRLLNEFKLTDDVYENYSLQKPNVLKIEDDCNLTSVVSYPLSIGKEKNLVISNDAYKIRQVNTYDDKLQITKTSLGPCFGGPITLMRVVPGKDKDKRLIAFSTKEKIMGLMSLPIDGNPYRYMGVIAHPGDIKNIKSTHTFNYLFTTGGSDYTINIWKYNPNPLIDVVQSGGEGIEPFLNLLEGGRDGFKYKEMVDYFYYAQIKSKDENTTKQRILDQTVTVNLIHGMLASLGYYPSNEEILNIQNEVMHMKISEGTKDKNDDINFETFVKIYLNHRPYIEVDVDQIENSFDNMREQKKYHLVNDDNEIIIVREKLIEVLQLLKIDEKRKDGTIETRRKIDDNTIMKIIKDLDGNSPNTPITSMEHFQKKLSRDNFINLLRDNRIEDKEINFMLEKMINENSMNNLPSQLIYKMGDRLISRENFLHMLKENGEKMDDKEIGDILKVLVGDPNPNNLPPMLSFDYIFENILLMEKEDVEVNK